jgi:hypothetical protein
MELRAIEQQLRKSENDNGTTMLMLNLTDQQWAALSGALHFWRQEVKKNEEDRGIGIYEPCGLEGVDGIMKQLEEGLKPVLET